MKIFRQEDFPTTFEQIFIRVHQKINIFVTTISFRYFVGFLPKTKFLKALFISPLN